MYEQLLGDLRSAGNAGEYYTPRAVTEFMVERIDPQLGEGSRSYDPACGTGGFLVCAIEHLRKRRKGRGGGAEDPGFDQGDRERSLCLICSA